MITSKLTAVAQTYDALSYEYDKSFLRNVDLAENEAVFDLIDQWGCNIGNVLDIGCGTGLFLEKFPKSKLNYFGVDISSGIIMQAKKKFPDNDFIVADFLNTECDVFHRSMYDSAVSLFGSFSYILDPEEALAKLYRFLKPRGRFMIMFFGHKYINRKSYIINRVNEFVPALFYNKKALQSIFSKVNFKRVNYVGLNLFSERLPRSLKTETVKKFMQFESALFNYKINDFYYLIAIGEK